MKVLITNPKTGLAEAAHMESSQARAWIIAGLAVEAPPEVKKTPTDTKWFVKHGVVIEGYRYAPELIHQCSTCTSLKGGQRTMSGPTSHLAVIKHCSLNEACPSDVQAEYVNVRKEWEAGQPKPKRVITSSAASAIQTKRFRVEGTELVEVKG